MHPVSGLIYIPIFDQRTPKRGVVAVLEVMVSKDASEAMLLADVISYVGTILNCLQVSTRLIALIAPFTLASTALVLEQSGCLPEWCRAAFQRGSHNLLVGAAYSHMTQEIKCPADWVRMRLCSCR